MTWEQEKAYRQKRAAQLAAQMEKALEEKDLSSFRQARDTAGNYMTRKELKPYTMRMLQILAEERRAQA